MAAPVAISVGTSATVVSAANNNRTSLLVQNLSTADVYVGETSGLTTANGILLKPNERLVLTRVSPETFYYGAIYGRVASGTADVRVWEREYPAV